MSARLCFAVAILLSSAQVSLGASYNLVKDISGQTFFDSWSYYGSYDNLTSGDVIWVNQSVADGTPQLTYINDAGNAIVKVDNSTTVPYNDKRNSVRLTSNDKFGLGTVVVFDVKHVPYGCSVWPSLWTKAIGNLWPAGGEIDIFEAVNLQTANQMALHTVGGCTQATGVTQTGTTGQVNCDNNSSAGAGCTVIDANADSYGAPLAAAGGGVWILEFATAGINIWFTPRASIPSSLSTNTIDTSTFGTPSGSWPASSCNPSQFFDEQEIVIDITLCGEWAGLAPILEATCPALTGTNTCYTTYVLDPTNYDNAYFEIASVKLFGTSPSVISTAADSTPTTTAGGSSSSSSTSSHSDAVGRHTSNALLASGALLFIGMSALF